MIRSDNVAARIVCRFNPASVSIAGHIMKKLLHSGNSLKVRAGGRSRLTVCLSGRRLKHVPVDSPIRNVSGSSPMINDR